MNFGQGMWVWGQTLAVNDGVFKQALAVQRACGIEDNRKARILARHELDEPKSVTISVEAKGVTSFGLPKK